MKKIFLWKLLVNKGIFSNKELASKWIMAGKVLVDNQRIDKCGYLVLEDAEIRIKDYEKKYASKGGIKLEGALNDFNIDVTGKVVLDVGASTGGFTDCLIQYGAKKVYAVDVGFGQLMGKLRSDKRVVNMEKTNISDIKKSQMKPPPVLAVVDLSYLSIKKAIPVVFKLLHKKGLIICLVKPLFEIADPDVRRTGIIKDSKLYKDVLQDLVKFFLDIDIITADITYSHITGNKCTREFFMLLTKDKCREMTGCNNKIDRVVASSLKLKNYKKNNNSLGYW